MLTKLLKPIGVQSHAQHLLQGCSHTLIDGWKPESVWGHTVTRKDQLEVVNPQVPKEAFGSW